MLLKVLITDYFFKVLHSINTVIINCKVYRPLYILRLELINEICNVNVNFSECNNAKKNDSITVVVQMHAVMISQSRLIYS